ncbi:MAG: hypothetical protein WAK98_11475 [Gemmobacter sp.]
MSSMQNPPVFAHQADFSTWARLTLIRIKYASDTSEMMQLCIAPAPAFHNVQGGVLRTAALLGKRKTDG